jgi:hypothetical protein
MPPMSENFAARADFVEYQADIARILAECGDVPGVDPMVATMHCLIDLLTCDRSLSSSHLNNQRFRFGICMNLWTDIGD